MIGIPLLALLLTGTPDQEPPAYVYPPVVPSRKVAGFPDNNFRPAPYTPPTPQRDVTFDGGLVVRAAAPQNSRLPIGRLIKLTYEFEHPENVLVDLTAIKEGTFGLTASDLQWRDPDHPAVRVTTSMRGDKVVDRVDISLIHFVWVGIREVIEFKFDFRYAYQMTGDAPDFITKSTQPVELTVVRSGDSSMTPRQGTLEPAPVRTPPAAPYLIYGGLCLMATGTAYGVMRLKQWLLPGRGWTRHQRAVATLRRVSAASSKTDELTREQCTQLAAALRLALGNVSSTGVVLPVVFAQHKQRDLIVEVLSALDLVASVPTMTLSGAKRQAVLEKIARILGDV